MLLAMSEIVYPGRVDPNVFWTISDRCAMLSLLGNPDGRDFLFDP